MSGRRSAHRSEAEAVQRCCIGPWLRQCRSRPGIVCAVVCSGNDSGVLSRGQLPVAGPLTIRIGDRLMSAECIVVPVGGGGAGWSTGDGAA